MSVPSWKRTISRSEYVYRAFMITQRIGTIVANKPKKYKQNYGDKLITASLDLLMNCQVANSIYVRKDMPQADFDLRRQCLMKARALSDFISTSSFIFLELCRNCDGANNEKLSRQEDEIGNNCYNLRNLISAVMKSDIKRFN